MQSVVCWLIVMALWGAFPIPAPAETYPGTDDGAKLLLREFLKPGADCPKLSRNLKPTPADYQAYFDAAAAEQAAKVYGPAWEGKKVVISPNPGQTELVQFKATTDELKAGAASSREFPGGYKKIAARLNPGITVYAFKFVKPGESSGMSYDGLVFLNGRWIFFPKPWRALGTE